MTTTLNFEVQETHKYFSTHCFNQTWDYIEKVGERTVEDDLAMLHTAIASLWHWSQREDASPQNLSVGYWQVARVYCLIKQPHNARTYGLLALKYARDLSPFYKGYAYESLARAEMIVNNRVIMKTHLEKAREMLGQIEDREARELLARDLESIR
jgi:hypothetical protein